MIRVFDKELINSFLTQDDILPEFFKVKGDPADHDNVLFMLGEVGLFVCIRIGSAIDCHAAIPKDARGKQAYKDALNLKRWLFQNTACDKLITRADKTKKHLLHFNAKLLERKGEDDKFVYYEVHR